MDNTGTKQKSNLRAVQERIAAIQRERQRQTLTRVKANEDTLRAELARMRQSTELSTRQKIAAEFGGLVAALRQQQDAEDEA